MSRLRALWDRLTRGSATDPAELHAKRLLKRRIGPSDQRRAAPWFMIR
jgi:hypothetical protein